MRENEQSGKSVGLLLKHPVMTVITLDQDLLQRFQSRTTQFRKGFGPGRTVIIGCLRKKLALCFEIINHITSKVDLSPSSFTQKALKLESTTIQKSLKTQSKCTHTKKLSI